MVSRDHYEECVELHEDETTKVTKDDIFKEDVYHLKEIASKLQKTMDKLTQFKAWALSRATLWSGYMHKERNKEYLSWAGKVEIANSVVIYCFYIYSKNLSSWSLRISQIFSSLCFLKSGSEWPLYLLRLKILITLFCSFVTFSHLKPQISMTKFICGSTREL